MNPAQDVSGPRPLCVLVIEHHADTRTQLSRLLRAYDLDVRSADCCAAARRAVVGDEPAPDVVVGEMQLPDGDGVDLMSELKASHGCPTIAFTSRGMAADVARCKAAGIDRHLLKPMGVRDLRDAIESLARCA
jgi:DNA-binding response OmpR family regulator